MVSAPLHLIAYQQNPLAELAAKLLDDNRSQLPDLTGITILLPEKHLYSLLRRELLRQAKHLGYSALLGPQINTLRDWALRHLPADKPLCSRQQRELILYNVLCEHKQLLGNASPWQVCDDLLRLFDTLTLNRVELPDDFAEFAAQITRAYGVTNEVFSGLNQEAQLVHHLWQSWHQQLVSEQQLDTESAYLLGLSLSLEQLTSPVYLIGYCNLSTAETQWLQKAVHSGKLQCFQHGQLTTQYNDYHPDAPVGRLLQALAEDVETSQVNDTYSLFLNACYNDTDLPLQQRAQQFAQHHADPVRERLSTCLCHSHEEQARAVETQVRRWLLEGKQRIGIVTENRRLARRVRALLERADILLQDYSGWALSTTRAATVIERWLECIEEDFAHLPLLDLLKSSFIFAQYDDSEVKQATYRLEHDIIRQENIARNINRYRHHIQSRHERLQWESSTTALLLQIFAQLEQAAKPLQQLLRGKHNAEKILQRLVESLEQVGVQEHLNRDAAGKRIIAMLQLLQQTVSRSSFEFSWSEFRTWLGRHLESHLFIPNTPPGPVSLLGLRQSNLHHFDAVVVASAEKDHLPGKLNNSIFFNESVRLQLGLPTRQSLLAERFYYFRRLLESSAAILITACHEEEGEEVPLSPWLELLQTFYTLAYQHTLHNQELFSLIQHTQAEVLRGAPHPLPAETVQPAPVVPRTLLPQRYSPSSYQQLINCPYQFFVAQCLQLTPSEEVQLALSKSDYGERVHLCLQAFHSDVEHLPGPFTTALNQQNRQQAIELLTTISQQVFARDLLENFEHAGWFAQWQKIIPQYIDWEIQRAADWRPQYTEYKSRVSWVDELNLHGRLDRIDSHDNELGILDYKTGATAKQQDILCGEAVQLPFYALLAQQEFSSPVSQVGYLKLDKGVKIEALDDQQVIAELSQEIASRLSNLHKQLQQGSALPAWGDEKTCTHCNMQQLCRLQNWVDTVSDA